MTATSERECHATSFSAYCTIKAVIFICLFACAGCLRMSAVRVPAHVAALGSARLECMYELQGETLYSVKWYKDGDEFYRYQPSDEPPGLVFQEPGLHVNEENSSASHVTLARVPLTASGRYRCEVSGEAPSFHTVSDHGDMTVVAVPESGPVISGGKPRYQLGEWAHLNCSVTGSWPAATLAWFINGEPAESGELEGPSVARLPPPRAHLLATTLGLRFKVRSRHFRRGDMKLKCLAMIGTLYSRSNEESVEGDRLQKGPALESRNAVAAVASDSRADRVQASSSGASSGCSRHRWPPSAAAALWCACGVLAAATAALGAWPRARTAPGR